MSKGDFYGVNIRSEGDEVCAPTHIRVNEVNNLISPPRKVAMGVATGNARNLRSPGSCQEGSDVFTAIMKAVELKGNGERFFLSFMHKARWFAISRTIGDEFTPTRLPEWEAERALSSPQKFKRKPRR